MSGEIAEFESDPYSLFIFAMNSASTKGIQRHMVKGIVERERYLCK